jgi:hypothetical protein
LTTKITAKCIATNEKREEPPPQSLISLQTLIP